MRTAIGRCICEVCEVCIVVQHMCELLRDVISHGEVAVVMIMAAGNERAAARHVVA